jgi:hypothetical protein
MEARFGVTHLEHLDREAAIPVVSLVAFQGDVAILRRARAAATTPIPAAGYPVVAGENGGNTHAVYGVGFYDPAPRSDTELLLGVLTVPDGEQVLLSHPEHGGFLIEPGTYEIRRQREQADEIRLVQD